MEWDWSLEPDNSNKLCCGTEVSPDAFREGWLSSPHVVVKLNRSWLSRSWVSGSPSAFTSGKRQKEGDTILGTAAQHLLKKCCRASAALQIEGLWRGFQSRRSSWGSDLVPVAAPVDFWQEVHFAGLTSKSHHLTVSAEVTLMEWLFLQGVDEGNSQVCICTEEATAGVSGDHGHNPVIIAATWKRLINVIFCLANEAQTFTSCLWRACVLKQFRKEIKDEI